LLEFFSTRQTLLIWRITVDLRVGHSIYELTFHPRNAGVALFAVSDGAALRWITSAQKESSIGVLRKPWDPHNTIRHLTCAVHTHVFKSSSIQAISFSFFFPLAVRTWLACCFGFLCSKGFPLFVSKKLKKLKNIQALSSCTHYYGKGPQQGH
jgi:hypothetical protein